MGNNFKIHSETIPGDFCTLANSLSVAVEERKGGVLQDFYTNTGFLHLLWNGTVGWGGGEASQEKLGDWNAFE